MSLDVYLEGKEITAKCTCTVCGHEHDRKYNECFFDQNITHNLSGMAAEGGFREAVWEPSEVGITKASELIPILRKAVSDMKAEPDRFMKHNAPNGWGLYEHFLPWLERYLEACIEHPEATIDVRG